jgi:multicomponent Na+:H+ antiporter subunit D
MAHMAGRIAETGMDAPLLLAFGLFICGFSFKTALVPFHAWLPDAHPSAPAPVSAMLSGVLIKAIGIYVLARLVFNVFGVGESELALLRWLGILSMVVGGLLAAGQKDIKRLFA